MQLTNKVYNAVKWIAQYLLPAAGTLYFAIASIWDLPYAEQIVGTISAITIFLGVILGISTSHYIKSGADTDGTLEVDRSSQQKDIYRIVLDGELSTLSSKSRVALRVNNQANLSQE